MTAGTGKRAVFRIRRIVLQQLRQRGSSRLVHGGADGGLDCFQVQAAGLAAILKDDAQSAAGLLRGQFPDGWTPPFFFLGGRLDLIDGPQTADLSIDVDQLTGQGLELAELGDFVFRLTDGGLRRQVLCNGLAVDLLGELRMGAVPGVVGSGAMAPRFSAAPGSISDGAGLEIAELRNLLENGGSVVDQGREWVRHGVSLSYSIISFKNKGAKKENSRILTSMSRTLGFDSNTR
jgi:hypothetical protein